MQKKDEIILIIAKAFSNQDFTKKEFDECCKLNHLILMTEFGLSDLQTSIVLNWCKMQSYKHTEKCEEEI